jgi:hypothetical protein
VRGGPDGQLGRERGAALDTLLARLAEAEEGEHICDTAEEGWRPCPPSLCEGERLLTHLLDVKVLLVETQDALVIEMNRKRAAETDRDRYRDALRKSAEALHGLSDDPVHLRNIFAECPDHHCVAARAALNPEQP